MEENKTAVDLEKAQEILDDGVEKAKEVLENNEELNKLVDDVKAKIDGVPALKSTLENAPVLFSMLKSYANKEYTEVQPRVITTVVSAFMYLIKRKDLIPDRIPLLGIVDDLAVMGVALKYIEPDLNAYKAWRQEHPEKKEEGQEGTNN